MSQGEGCPSPEEWRRFQEGDVADKELERLAAHQEGCPACREVLATFPREDGLTGEWVPACEAAADPEARQAVERAIAAVAAQGRGARTDTPGETATAEPGVVAPLTGLPSVPGYEVLAKLAEGGMGTVYRALDTRLGRFVALKLIRPDRLTQAMCRRFLSEAQAVARLDHHHIIRIFEVGECQVEEGSAPVPYLALEYVDGDSLEKRLGDQPLEPAEAARLVRLLARAIHHAHEKGIVHRDLKPANVLLAPATDELAMNVSLGCPKIADFGLARQVERDGRLTQSGTALGTPAYMAPEQAEGSSDVGPPADVWALGVILYRALTGRLPFVASSSVDLVYKVCREMQPPVRQIRPEVPEELERICLECLSKAPAKRPSAFVLASQLEGWLSQGPPGAVPGAGVHPSAEGPVLSPNQEPDRQTRAQEPSRQKPGRRWLVWAGGLAALALLLVGAGLGIERWSRQPVGLQDERLVLRIWSADGFKKGWRLGIDPGALPARKGDQIRAEVRLNQAAHIYLLVLEAQGEVVPLYPWHQDVTRLDRTLSDPPPEAPAQLELTWPSLESGRGLELDDKDGLETILLLARRTPLPPTVSLADLVGQLPLPPSPLGALQEFAVRGGDAGQPVDAIRIDQFRGVRRELKEIDDPLEKLLVRLQKHFELLRAVRYAHQGR